jgi:hypothetical protein
VQGPAHVELGHWLFVVQTAPMFVPLEHVSGPYVQDSALLSTDPSKSGDPSA